MSMATAFLDLNQGWGEVLPWLNRQLRDAGFRVKKTFDLQAARQPQAECSCLYHGTAQCNCQMLVLLVYRDQGDPITLTIHGYDGSTYVSLVDIPGQRADPHFETMIRRLLTPSILPGSSVEGAMKAGSRAETVGPMNDQAE